MDYGSISRASFVFPDANTDTDTDIDYRNEVADHNTTAYNDDETNDKLSSPLSACNNSSLSNNLICQWMLCWKRDLSTCMNMNSCMNIGPCTEEGIVFRGRRSSRIFTLRAILLGQLLSFILAVSAAANSSLEDRCSISCPTAQTCFVYCMLCIVYLRPRMFSMQRKDESNGSALGSSESHWNVHWCRIFPFALLDVESNYLSVLAFRYTTIANVTLLDAFAIPSSMLFCQILNLTDRQYDAKNYMGVCICLVGLFTTVLGNLSTMGNQGNASSLNLWGNILASCGGILYGLNDAFAEKLVKEYDRKKYLAFIGLFGAIISIVQISFLESNELESIFSKEKLNDNETDCPALEALFLLFIAVTANTLFYSGVSLFLASIAGAAPVLNLSLLTSDLWAVLFTIVVQKKYPSYLYCISFLTIFGGIVVYESPHIFIPV